MADYSLTANNNVVLRNVDHVFIPKDTNNVDWQAYLAWTNGNTPDPYVPPPPSPQQQFTNALSSGLILTFSTTTTLSATYAIDAQTQANLTAEMVSILVNGTFGTGQTTRYWPDLSGQYHEVTIAQFKELATAITLYVNQLYATINALEAGQQTNWPVNKATVNA